MRWLIWVVFSLGMLLWTMTVLIGTKVLGWIAGLSSQGHDASAVAQAVQSFPWPAWLALWVDPAWLEQLAQAVAHSWAWLTTILPVFTTLVGWLVPIVWFVWGLVSLAMLALAVLLHVLAGRAQGQWSVVAASVRRPHGG